jgi:hypothetical protein
MLGLPVTGLLAILVEAAITGDVEFDDALSRLLATGFRPSPSLPVPANHSCKPSSRRRENRERTRVTGSVALQADMTRMGGFSRLNRHHGRSEGRQPASWRLGMRQPGHHGQLMP